MMAAQPRRRCELCLGESMKTPHHIFTRGAHGEKALVPENEIDLCLAHHSEVHQIGRETFATKYGLTDRVRRAENTVRGIHAQ